jgi:hypothetical protein
LFAIVFLAVPLHPANAANEAAQATTKSKLVNTVATGKNGKRPSQLQALPISLENWEAKIGDFRLSSSTHIPDGFFKGNILQTYLPVNPIPGISKREVIARDGKLLTSKVFCPWETIANLPPSAPMTPSQMFMAIVLNELQMSSLHSVEQIYKMLQPSFKEVIDASWQDAANDSSAPMAEVDGISVSYQRRGEDLIIETQPISTLKKRAVAKVHGKPAD